MYTIKTAPHNMPETNHFLMCVTNVCSCDLEGYYPQTFVSFSPTDQIALLLLAFFLSAIDKWERELEFEERWKD